MINSLTQKYFEELEVSMISWANRINTAKGSREELAIEWGAGVPIYCDEHHNDLENPYRRTGQTFNSLIEGFKAPMAVKAEGKLSLLDLVVILYDNLVDDTFYGISAYMGDSILHVSHPIVLNSLLEIVDHEEPLFDNILIYSFQDSNKVDNIGIRKITKQFSKIYSAITNSNKGKYTLDVKFNSSTVSIKEAYSGSESFYAIIPVQTAYFGSVCIPYYGMDMAYINAADPVGIPIWPITSPNIDLYQSNEVCTGTSIKTLSGCAVLFDANFQSAFPYPAENGTLNRYFMEAIKVMQQETANILNSRYKEDFESMDGLIPDIIKVVERDIVPLGSLDLDMDMSIEDNVKKATTFFKSFKIGGRYQDMPVNVEELETFKEAVYDEYNKAEDSHREALGNLFNEIFRAISAIVGDEY